MVLSSADFAAYSRATGTPYPEDPEERAEMAPEVAEFRRNQLKTPSQESNALQTLGLTALGLGAAVGTVLGARQLLRSAPAKKVSTGRGTVLTDLTPELETAKRYTASRTTPPPSKIAQPEAAVKPSTINLSNVIPEPTIEEVEGALTAPRQFVYRPKGGIQDVAAEPSYADQLITDPNTGEIFRRGKSPESFAQTYISLRPELTGQKTNLPLERTPSSFLEFSESASGETARQRLLNDPELKQLVAQQKRQEGAELGREAQRQMRIASAIESEADQYLAQLRQESLASQTLGALESGEDQMTGRMKMQLSRNEDLDLSQIEMLENIAEENNALMREHADPSQMQGYVPDQAINQAASQLPDGPPLDQAEGKRVFDLSGGKSKITGNIVTQGSKQYFTASPNVLNRGQADDALVQEAIRHLRAQEIDTDFDYSLENKIQAAQVQDRIQKAQALQNQANQILSEIQAETQPSTQQLSPEEFASAFNKQYREELNTSLQLVDNARQRAEQRAAQTESTGEDLESLLLGESGTIETTMQGKALRGGKPNITGDIVYQDDAGNFVTADAGLKTRLNQGQQYEQRARRLNQLRSASDEELTGLFFQGQQAIANKQPMTQLDLDTMKFASEILRTRALKEAEPTRLQLDALERSKASIAKSQEILQTGRNLRPTVSPGPAQDVARSMETLRRAMIVDPSEPLPSYPSVQQLRTGFIDAGDYAELGPILSAPNVYTGAAAEAAGPVIFTGKSKANTVIKQPDITGSVTTPVGKYLTQDNPDVLGTVYKVAGTPANRAIAAQVEANAQAFLADALTGGLQQKTQRVPEPYRTPGTYGVQQLNLLTPPLSEKGFSQNPLGLTGPAPSQRTLYAQYQPGRSASTPLSPFIGEMPGGTVNVVPSSTAVAGMRRDIGASSGSIDLTRRGERGRYFSRYPEQPFVTGMEPAPIGPIVPSPGLSRVGGMQQKTIKGAGNLPITQLTTQGQKISYPHMDPLVKATGFRGEQITNVPRYGINPGAEDWRTDLMRSEFRRSGPLRRYQV